MNSITAKYWQTTSLLIILFFITIYIFLVSILSKEIAIFQHNPPAIAYELSPQQLTPTNDYLGHVLFIDNLATNNKQELVIKLIKKDKNWLVAPLSFVVINIILAALYPVLALLLVTFITAFLISSYQKRKLKNICNITYDIAETFGQKNHISKNILS